MVILSRGQQKAIAKISIDLGKVIYIMGVVSKFLPKYIEPLKVKEIVLSFAIATILCSFGIYLLKKEDNF